MNRKSARNKLLAISLLVLLAVSENASADWQITNSPGKTLDTEQPVLLTDGYALIGFNNDSVSVYDIATGFLIRNIGLPNGPPIEQRTFAADAGRLLIGDTIFTPNPIRGTSRAYAIDIATGRQLSELQLRTPTRRLAVGQSVATDGQHGLVSSIQCVAECETTDPTLRGVVDKFDMRTGEHLLEISNTDNISFATGLEIEKSVIAISWHPPNEQQPGRIDLFDAGTGDRQRTIEGATSNLDFDLTSNRLVVGQADQAQGSGVLRVYDPASGKQVTEFTSSRFDWENVPQLGHAVAASGEFIIAGAPSPTPSTQASGIVTPIDPLLESPARPAVRPNSTDGAVIIANIETGGYVSRDGWTGGDSVAIDGNFALVRSTSETQTNVYAISLAGLLPSTSNTVSAATRQSLGDLDGDGVIAFPDFLVLSDNFGSTVEGVAFGDLNGSGAVEFGDFLIFSDNYEREFAAATVPEPESFSLFAFAFGVCVIRLTRSRRGGRAFSLSVRESRAIRAGEGAARKHFDVRGKSTRTAPSPSLRLQPARPEGEVGALEWLLGGAR